MKRTAVRTCLASALVFFLHAGARAGDPPPSTWLDSIRDHIDAWEYAIGPNTEGSLQAPNRAQGFRTFFEPGRIRVEPRTESGASWEWGLTWIGYGEGPVPQATRSTSGARAEYRRGSLVEWYENSPRGLEQGFLLSSPPADDASGPLHLDLALTGTLSAMVAADGQAIDFVGGDGKPVLRYAELVVTDARGEKVATRMEAFVRADMRIVRLVLDVRDAVFPLTVDPLTTSPVLTLESDQASANFGASVATAGDVNGDGFSDFLIGVPFFDNGETNEGQVRLFLGSASGVLGAWTFEANVIGGALLGSSVATAGDVNGDGYADVIVGAPGYDGPENNEGRAYLFLGSAAGLSPTPAWTAESNLNFASFGSAVGSAGDVNGDGYSDVVVGASTAGRAYLYLGSPTGLSTVPAWTANSTSTSRYGAAVGTAGDVNGDGYSDVVIGAPNYENGQTAEGAVFVYPGSAAGLGTPPWFSEGDHAGGVFGSSVGTAGDVNGDGYADLIVGAPLYDFGQTDEGLAFVYLGSSTGITFSPAWYGESDQIAGHYGSSVGTAGDVNGDGYADFLVAGEQITNGQSNEGRVWLYYGGPTLPSLPAWTHETDQTGAGIKVAVGTAGDVNGDGYSDVLVGFPNLDSGQTDEGQVRLFLGSAGTPATSPAWLRVPDLGGLYLARVESAGDVNGDGYADFLLGARSYVPGRAELYLGSPSGVSATPAWVAEGDAESTYFGWTLGTAGDVNGDGYGDVVVGSWDDTIRVYLGSVLGLATSPAWTVNVQGAGSPKEVSTAGDVNGDGYGDLLVGVPSYGPDRRGRAMVYLGSAGGLSLTPAWTVEGSFLDQHVGDDVATAGDVNRDGFSDVLVQAEQGSNRLLLYLGSGSGLSTTPAWTPGDSGLHFTSFGAAGDVNGDGYADVVAGDGWYPGIPFPYGPGKAFLYLGSASGLSPAPAWTVDGVEPGGQRGETVAAAGDVNGDGFGDVLISGTRESNGQVNEGRAHIYLGSSVGLAPLPAWSVESDDTASRFGDYMAGPGDVNGDGYADVLVAAPLYDWSDGGRVYFYYGNGGPGVPLVPVQGQATDGTPIALLGAADVPAFGLASLDARIPFGRGKVKLEVEVKPVGQTFDGQLTILGSFRDTDLAGTPLTVLTGDLPSSTLFHWRMRLHYDPATTPLASRSRWFTRPWGGWSETMLRTPAASPLGHASGLTLGKSGLVVNASWTAPCASDAALYEGTLGSFTSHVPVTCSAGGSTLSFTPQAGNRYFVVVPIDAVAEGSYGILPDGTERPRSASACRPQQSIGVCP